MKDDKDSAARAGRGFTIEDLLSFQVLADLDVSPDGRTVVYAVTGTDVAADATFTNLWRVPADGGSPQQLTFGTSVNDSPRISPDGSQLAFLSNRGGSIQLHVMPLGGGEARPVTDLPSGAGAATWSPDGSRLAFAIAVPDGSPEDGPRAVRRSSYKADGVGFIANRPSQVFVVSAAGGDARQLTKGDGSCFEPQWSPDGRRLVLSRQRTGRADSHRSDVWTIDVDTGEERQLTTRSVHSVSPTFSPDGSRIAYYGGEEDGDPRRSVWVVSSDGGDERSVTSVELEIAAFPLAITKPPAFSKDGAEVAVVTTSRMRSGVSMIRLDDGRARVVLGGSRQISMAATSHSGDRIAFVWSELHVCGKLGAARWDGSGEQLLVDVNAAWGEGRAWPKAELREVPGTEGRRNECLLLLPEGKGPFPLLVDVHGGPHSYVELGYPYHPYWYVLATRGWAVMALNPVGSSSYGDDMVQRLRGRWGIADLPEQLAAVDALVKEGIADDQRVAIAGKSYGGYMAAWAIGKTNRFRAAVCSAGVMNLESHYGTSDSGSYVDPYNMAGDIVEVRERYHELSPIHAAKACQTPTLILQGEDDQRCPVGQGEELFQALVRRSKAEVELVLYPGGDHHLAETGKPSHRVDYHGRIVAWLERHVTRA
ncbi:MAG: hypothetical protein JWP97_1492 [Labilithrix sp.]|nr:hypothetical protein [Labilithrix sp.]